MSGVDLLARFLTAFKFTLPFDQVRDDPALSLLSDLGVIEFRDSSAKILCDACDSPHSVEIGIDPVTDKLGWRCPEAGFVEASSDQLRAVRVLPDVLADQISNALQCRRRKTKPLIEGRLWSVGWYEFHSNDVNIYLATGIRSADDASAIAGALQAEPGLRNGLVITPDLTGAVGLTIAKCRFVEIGDLIEFKNGGLSCDSSRVARFAGVVARAGPGRPQQEMRGEVADTIRRFYEESRIFTSKRKAGEAIQEDIKARFPRSHGPGRSVVEDEIDASEFGCFLVGK